MESHRERILKKIRQAMVSACRQTELFTGDPASQIAAEYLLTVAVATAIAELNGPPGEPYIIQVERDAKTFMKDCVPQIKFASDPARPGSSRIIRPNPPSVSRTGRVDVTVYSDIPKLGYFGVNPPPLCAIELKGFAPGARDVQADLVRLLQFLRTTGTTGDSVLGFAVFAALYSYRRKHLERNRKCAERLYHRYLSRLGDLSDIDSACNVDTISVDQVGKPIEWPEYVEVDTSTKHHFIGVMVVLSRKTGSSGCADHAK